MKKNKGKKFTTFTWRSQAGEQISVPVWHVEEKLSYASSTSRVYFRAVYEDLSIYEENSDIDELRKIVFKKIEEKHSSTWKLYVYVTVEQGRWHQQSDKSIHFSHSFKATNGKGLWVSVSHITDDEIASGIWSGYNRNGQPVPYAPDVGTKTGFHGGDNDNATAALVPVTPDNIAALKATELAFNELGQRIRAMFEPDKIQDTLTTRRVPLITKGDL